MCTLGERLKYARKNCGYTQDSLAEAIGVSRGVIFNLEKSKSEPQIIVVNAICRTLGIRKEWLIDGQGDMEDSGQMSQSAKTLAELYNVVKDLSEDEQLYLLDIIRSLKTRLKKDDDK